MKIKRHFFKAPLRVFTISRKRKLFRLKKQMLYIRNALAQEKKETKEMLIIYQKYSVRKASREEMREANKQFIDILKGLGIGVFAVLPFAPITIPLVIKIGRMVGVEILPSAFSLENDSTMVKSKTADKNLL